jgi:hypothetical protein
MCGANETFYDWSTRQGRALCKKTSVTWRFLQPFSTAVLVRAPTPKCTKFSSTILQEIKVYSYNKGEKKEIYIVDRISRETLEERLEEMPSNARCFAQGSSLMCWPILESLMGTIHGTEELDLCSHGLACLARIWPYLEKRLIKKASQNILRGP